MLRAILPHPYQIEVTRLRQTEFHKLRRQIDLVHLAWVTEWKRRQSDFKIENIRFPHDPDWDRRFFSVQAAHDGKGWFWWTAHLVIGPVATSI